MKHIVIRLLVALMCLATITGCATLHQQNNANSSATTAATSAAITAEDFFKLSAKEQVEAYRTLDPQIAYQVIKESNSSWCVTAYDLITPQNVKDFVIIYLKDFNTTAFNLAWPFYGGYDPKTIASIKDLSGRLSVSRIGGDGGYCLSFGTNPDGSQFTNSQRSVPVSHNVISAGTMDVDLYKKTVDIVAGVGSKEQKIDALKALGIDQGSADKLISDYAAWFFRSEIIGSNNIQDGVALVGNKVEAKYGYYGKTMPWEVSNLILVGGSGQMNTVYSWGTLKESGIVTGVETLTID